MTSKSSCKYSNLATSDVRNENWSNYEEEAEEHQTSESSDNNSSVYSVYNPEWKPFIDPAGNLFFLKCQPCIYPGFNHQNDNLVFRNEYKRMSLRRNKGILSKISGKKRSKKSLYDVKILEKHKYEHSDGILKEFLMSIKPSKFGKLKKIHQNEENIFENIFNATVLLTSDGKRYLIDKINEGSLFAKETSIKIGDVIKSIDCELITVDNLTESLKKIQSQKSFKLVLQELYPDEMHLSSEEIKLTKLDDLLENKDKLFNLNSEPGEIVFSMILMRKIESESADDEEGLNAVFCYPPQEINIFHKIKGCFLTIDSILRSSFASAPLLTSFSINDKTYHLSYCARNQEQEYLFLGFNSDYSRLIEAKNYSKNLVQFLDYFYPNFTKVENFKELENFCELFKLQILKNSNSKIPMFEQMFNFNVNVQLPKEIFLRINDSLSELEAMDYRNWNEDLMGVFGKFNVIGTCLFYKTFLICSHLNAVDMANVELFLRYHCLKMLYSSCSIKEIVIWQRVYPKIYQSFNVENDSEVNKIFLVIVAHGNLLMCVLLEENGYHSNHIEEGSDLPEYSEADKKESANYLIYYLEEIEDILDHLKIVGIENLTRIWINSQKRPQIRHLFDGSDLQSAFESETMSLKTIREDQEENQDGDSDWENMDSQKSSSAGFDDLSDNIYKEFTDIIPQQLTSGPENVLYHYTQLDVGDGCIITSINEFNQGTGKNDLLLDVFRRGCLKIHSILQNSIKYKQILSKDSKTTPSKSLVAVKEHGILLQLKSDNNCSTEIWIVGRLFTVPQRELYVCYDSKIPQNLVEIAFRICLNCVG